MNTILYGQDNRCFEWVFERTKFKPRGDAIAIGFGDNTNLRAVTIWDGFSDADCNIHVATDEKGHWLTRAFLTASFAHPFVQWNLRRVTALVPANNHKALKFDLHLGFKQEGVIREGETDCDLLLLGMLRRECRFIPQNYRR